jgi:hypothetical protein
VVDEVDAGLRGLEVVVVVVVAVVEGPVVVVACGGAVSVTVVVVVVPVPGARVVDGVGAVVDDVVGAAVVGEVVGVGGLVVEVGDGATTPVRSLANPALVEVCSGRR